MNQKLIHITSSKTYLVHCTCCDGPSTDVKEWWSALDSSGYLESFSRYLSCCYKSMGEVVDWCDYDDYCKVIKKSTYGNTIKGYKYEEK